MFKVVAHTRRPIVHLLSVVLPLVAAANNAYNLISTERAQFVCARCALGLLGFAPCPQENHAFRWSVFLSAKGLGRAEGC